MAGCNFDNVTLHETLGWRCWEYWDIGILGYWDDDDDDGSMTGRMKLW